MGIVILFSFFGAIFGLLALLLGYSKFSYMNLYSISNTFYVVVFCFGFIIFMFSANMFVSMMFPKEISKLKEFFTADQKIYDSRFSLELVESPLMKKVTGNILVENEVYFQSSEPFSFLEESPFNDDDRSSGSLFKFKNKNWLLYHDYDDHQQIIREVSGLDAIPINEFYYPSLIPRSVSALKSQFKWDRLYTNSTIAIDDDLILSFINSYAGGGYPYLVDLKEMKMVKLLDKIFDHTYNEIHASSQPFKDLGYLIAINSMPESYSGGANPHTVSTRSDLYLYNKKTGLKHILVRNIVIGRINRLLSFEDEIYVEIIDDRDKENQFDKTKATLTYYKLNFNP